MTLLPYDEFGLFHENAAEYGLSIQPPVIVRRVEVPVAPSRTASALIWGSSDPQVVFVHGGAQNAHTWDTVALALGVPLVAVDLAGHGHSGWRDDGVYSPLNLADDLAIVAAALAPNAKVVVGMSLGGLTSMVLAARYPELVRRLVMVDVTPGVNQNKAKAVIDFINGPQTFASFDELLARTMEHNPTRAESSLRRGILHNAHQDSDGSWSWNYDRRSHARSRDADEGSAETPLFSPLWDDFTAVACPITLIRGFLSPVVDDDDVAEATRRQPSLHVEVVEGAGHSIQGDRPLELAAIVRHVSRS